MRFYLVIFLSITLMFSCSSTKNAGVQEEEAQQVEPEVTSGKILFLTFSGERQEGKKEFTLEAIKQVGGDLKKKLSNATDFKDGDLICKVFDNNNNLLSQEYITNPFIKEFEYATENGQLTKDRVEVDGCKFFVRLHIEGTTARIVLVDAISGKLFFEEKF